jgi:cytochrome c2
MKNVFNIFCLTLLTTLFYWYVGQMVPQKETHPPESAEVREDMSTEEMVVAGEKISTGKGTCFLCHTMGSEGSRAPDLAGVGRRAASRKEGFSDIDYLAESLFEPSAYVVDGYNPIMTPAHKAPISLTQPETLAVIAYLQSLGGAPTVTMKTKLKYSADAAPTVVASSDGAAVSYDNLSGEELFNKYACMACHSLTDPIQLLGPSLYDVGNRLSRAEIYESIIDPDAVVIEGFVKGVMGATLQGAGFDKDVTPQQLRTMVEFLSEKKGS